MNLQLKNAKKFEEISNKLFDGPDEKLEQELNKISIRIGLHKFGIMKIKNKKYTIKYNKRQIEYHYYLPHVTERRLLMEKDEQLNIFDTLILSWYREKSVKCYVGLGTMHWKK